MAGYYTYGTEVASDILVSYPQTKLLSAARIFISVLVAFSYPLQCLPSRASATTLWASCDDVCCKSTTRYETVTVDEDNDTQSAPEPGLSRPASPGSSTNDDDSEGDAAAELVGLTGDESVADVKAAMQADSSARCRYITLTTVFLAGTLTVINDS